MCGDQEGSLLRVHDADTIDLSGITDIDKSLSRSQHEDTAALQAMMQRSWRSEDPVPFHQHARSLLPSRLLCVYDSPTWMHAARYDSLPSGELLPGDASAAWGLSILQANRRIVKG